MGEKGERPERVFPGRTDPWFITAMVIVAGGLSAACIACFLSSSPALLWGWLALLPVPALVALAALPVRSNRLEFYGDVLRRPPRRRVRWDAFGDTLRPRAGRPAHQDALGGDGQLARPRLHRGALRRRRHRLGDRQRRPRGRAGAQVWPWARRLTPRREEKKMGVPHWPY